VIGVAAFHQRVRVRDHEDVVGGRSPEEAHRNLAAYAQHVPDELWADLEHRASCDPWRETRHGYPDAGPPFD
jgi:hypothetical protein